MLRIHSVILVICSCVGFVGHFLQFGVMRITPWIPATFGVMIFESHLFFCQKESPIKYLPITITFIFGIITTIMCIRFLPQSFQPLRKKIIFSSMSISAWTTLFYTFKTILQKKG